MEYDGTVMASMRVIDALHFLEDILHYEIVVEEFNGAAKVKAKSLSRPYPDLEGYVADASSEEQWLEMLLYMIYSIGEEDGYRQERA